MFRLFLAFFLLLALSSEALAQRGGGGGVPGQRGGAGGPGGGGPGGGGQRGAGGLGGGAMGGRQRPDQPATPPGVQPQPQPESQPPSRPEGRSGSRPEGQSSGEATTANPGVETVPQLATPADQVMPLRIVSPLSSDTIVPGGVPYKVVRYATRIFEKYDLNGNGFLEREEWSKMPGSPQSIDTDGDFIISLDEMIRFIALYGSVRTIHRPNPPPTPASSNWTSAEMSPFRPLSAPPKQKKDLDESKSGKPETDLAEKIDGNQIVGDTDSESAKESTDESEGENHSEKLEDWSYETIFSNQFPPAERKYYVPSSELKGVPYWFVQRDKNGDGQLSMLEFDPTLSPKGLAEFGRLDKNGDGFLTPDEVRVEK